MKNELDKEIIEKLIDKAGIGWSIKSEYDLNNIIEFSNYIISEVYNKTDITIDNMTYMRNTMHRLGLSCDESIESFSANFETELPRLLRAVNKLLDTL